MESIVVVSQNDESAKKEAKTGKKDGKWQTIMLAKIGQWDYGPNLE